MINLNKNAPAGLAFVGAITFCGSYVHDDRATRVMDFGTMVDWMKSAHDYFAQMVLAGDYDGSEIFIDIYEYQGGQIADSLNWDFVIDQCVISV